MHPVLQPKDSLQLFARMWVPGSLKESDDLRGNLRGEPYLHAKSDDYGARNFSKFWRWSACLPILGDGSVSATSPLLDEARPIKHLADNQITLDRIMLTGQVVRGDPQWEFSGAPANDPIIESGVFMLKACILFVDGNSLIC
jgi:hypothetical protein